jgi:Fe-S oxidoreductase
MYDRQYGWGDYARKLYGALPAAQRWSEQCTDCGLCQDACPFGVDAPARVNDARARLG